MYTRMIIHRDAPPRCRPAAMPRQPEKPCLTLNDVPSGRRARIRRHRASGAVRQRLMDLGLMPDVEVLVVRSAPLNDPIQLRLSAANVSLRRQEAATIEVHDDDA